MIKPYRSEINYHHPTTICIPQKIANSIKRGTIWCCRSCGELVADRFAEHCQKAGTESFEVLNIEKLGLHEISNREASKIFNFRDRISLIDFLDMKYGRVSSSEPLLLIELRRGAIGYT